MFPPVNNINVNASIMSPWVIRAFCNLLTSTSNLVDLILRPADPELYLRKAKTPSSSPNYRHIQPTFNYTIEMNTHCSIHVHWALILFSPSTVLFLYQLLRFGAH